MSDENIGLAGKIANNVWLKLLAFSFLGLAPIAGMYFANDFTRSMDRFSTAIEKLSAERATDRKDFELLNQYVKEGGRYTQDEAESDWKRQSEIDKNQTALLRELDQQLRSHELDDARARSDNSP